MESVSLLKLVEELKGRIDEHVHEFQKSEALTRYALINPLLRELGWDTENPKLVRPEFPILKREGRNKRFADYVLFTKCKPTIVVEAKPLDEPLQDGKNHDKAAEFCAHTGAKYFLLTDGRRYYLYDHGKYESGRDDSLVSSFSLTGSSSAEVCLKELEVLSKARFRSNSDDRQSELRDTTDFPPPHIGKWVPLTKVINKGNVGTKRMRPIELAFPRGKSVPLEGWPDLMLKLTRWSRDNNLLPCSSLPIPRSGNKKNPYYVVSTTPYHADGTPMKPEKISGVYMVLLQDRVWGGTLCVNLEGGTDTWHGQTGVAGS